ncbi:hypothetical protein [uncultured Dokdonia sp.]|uniref:hypothetical protein n=1 Tax=uncultured Dokdonia sp. TaxID=575653 RepID=UPI00260EA15B|nr:hypothetical protein [uncultured Dokdonia sp.]
MEFQYMQQLKDNPNLRPSFLPEESMSELEIIDLRDKYNDGNEFPLAFEEFLNISGKVCHIGIDTDYEGIFEDFMELIEDSGYMIDRPFFVIDRLDSQFSGFFLDEEKEDPDIYIYI